MGRVGEDTLAVAQNGLDRPLQGCRKLRFKHCCLAAATAAGNVYHPVFPCEQRLQGFAKDLPAPVRARDHHMIRSKAHGLVQELAQGHVHGLHGNAPGNEPGLGHRAYGVEAGYPLLLHDLAQGSDLLVGCVFHAKVCQASPALGQDDAAAVLVHEAGKLQGSLRIDAAKIRIQKQVLAWPGTLCKDRDKACQGQGLSVPGPCQAVAVCLHVVLAQKAHKAHPVNALVAHSRTGPAHKAVPGKQGL